MAQTNAVKPLMDLYGKVVDTFGGGKKQPNPKAAPADTSWHDKMVKEASESFRKQDDTKKPQQKKISADATTKVSKKSGPSKTATRKRISAK